MDYQDFINRKRQIDMNDGFEPLWMPDFLFPFQRHLVDWAIRKGRGAIFADCGLGKTPMQLVWSENVVRKTNRPVLILTPLAVAFQTVAEGERFGVDCEHSRDGKFSKKIVVTNYERLHYFNRHDFGAVVCDESSILKNFKGKTKSVVTEFMREMLYRLLCTATAAPNDFHELGTSSEALGHMGYRDMITTFFKQETSDGHAWGRTKYRFRGHAERPFWRWVCSWSRAIRKPSDLRFSDDGFDLPTLAENQHVVRAHRPLNGQLFVTPARDLNEQRQERRETIKQRCEWIAGRVNDSSDHAVVWCHLNPEGDYLAKIIPDAEQVSGSMSDDDKESVMRDFTEGNLRVLVTKPKIGCWGLNWQHCNQVYTFPSHSYEQYYQSIRRCWRFGQTRPVNVEIVTTEGEESVLKNLQRKSAQADRMFTELVACMGRELAIDNAESFPHEEESPKWLSSKTETLLSP